MAKKHVPATDHLVEDDYIDMDITSATFMASTPRSSPPRPTREFEFQMATTPEREPAASPADELFYQGKLLPLHLPPRLQMVENLLQTSSSLPSFMEKDLTAANSTPTSTPLESCNVSPAASCYASGELSTDDYIHDGSNEIAGPGPKKPWSKKIKFMRQFNLGLKLRASKAYIKSLFGTKPAGSDNASNGAARKAKECSNGYTKTWNKTPSGHRKSFSMLHSPNTASSSSSSSSCSSSNSSSFSSSSSNGPGGAPVLKRSSSANSELENSIQGAIAYCKNSQQLASVRKSVSDVGSSFVSGLP